MKEIESTLPETEQVETNNWLELQPEGVETIATVEDELPTEYHAGKVKSILPALRSAIGVN